MFSAGNLKVHTIYFLSDFYSRNATIAITQDLDMEFQERIVKEGINVFKLNNTIIHTVEGVDEIFYKKLYKWCSILLVLLAIIVYLFLEIV